jgi:hypothetical protein
MSRQPYAMVDFIPRSGAKNLASDLYLYLLVVYTWCVEKCVGVPPAKSSSQ